MPSRAAKTCFRISLYATPHATHQEIFYTVPRAGHLVGGTDHHVQRDHFPGHELILCRRGLGWVRIAGRTHRVRAGQLVWINCHRPHEHGADPNDPWEVYWVRTEGPRLEQMCAILAVAARPVIDGFDYRTANPVFRRVFALMASNAPDGPALIHAEIARLLALAFCARQRSAGTETGVTAAVDVPVPPALARPVERMRLYYFERHTVANLAARAGMSATHFARVFKAAFGTSPIDWLRRERISQAKRRLAGTTGTIKEIAQQVGYTDRYFFSKDFKRHTGLTPREFRQREGARDALRE